MSCRIWASDSSLMSDQSGEVSVSGKPAVLHIVVAECYILPTEEAVMRKFECLNPYLVCQARWQHSLSHINMILLVVTLLLVACDVERLRAGHATLSRMESGMFRTGPVERA